MFNNYPLSYQGTIIDEQNLNSRIQSIQSIVDLGVSLELFKSIIENLRNGIQHLGQSNEFTISGWVEFFSNQFCPIDIETNSLQLIMDYINLYKADIIRFNGVEYRTLGNTSIVFDEAFFIEGIVFMSYE